MKWLRWVLVILALLLVLAGLLLWTAPADVAYRWFGHRLGPIQLAGVSGTVWQGRAERATAFGELLGRVDWRIERGTLLRGVLTGDLQLAGDGVIGQAKLAASREQVEVRDLGGNFPASLLGPALDIPALMLLGKVDVQMSMLRLQRGVPSAMIGRITWRDMAVAGAASAALPGVQVDFVPVTDGSILGEIRDLGGPLAMQGQVRIQGSAFGTEVRLDQREPNPQLEEVLKYVGQRTPEGGSILRVQGEFKPLF